MIIDLIKGLAVTFSHIWRKKETVQYPEQLRPRPDYYRALHKLQRYKDGLERCVGCSLCASVCPTDAIYLEAKENDPENPVSPGERYSQVYVINELRCIFCGFCEEACPENAIVMGNTFEFANYERADFIYEKERLLVGKDEGFGDYVKHEY
jgi:NADH-quinone oxidoreductase subunit I